VQLALSTLSLMLHKKWATKQKRPRNCSLQSFYLVVKNAQVSSDYLLYF
jgi:hypothetical protein